MEESNFVVLFNEKRFNVVRGLFEASSAEFATAAKDCESLDMTDTVLQSSFEEFVNCCQMKSYTMNIENSYDLKYLAKKWNVSVLLKDFRKLKREVAAEDLALSKMLAIARQKSKYGSLVNVVANNFSRYVQTRQALSIPVNILGDILRSPELNCQQTLIFNLLVRQCEQGKPYQELFRFLDPHKLTAYETIWLKNNIQSSLHPGLSEASVALKDETAEEQKAVSVSRENKDKLKYSDLKQSFKQLKKYVDHKLQEFQNQSSEGKGNSDDEILKAIAEAEKKLDELKANLEDQEDPIADLADRHEDILYDLNMAITTLC